MADRRAEYESLYSGSQIDEAVRRVITGELDGVKSFNWRTGDVVPQTGDYTAEMVGAIPASKTGEFAKKSDLVEVEAITNAEIDAITSA